MADVWGLVPTLTTTEALCLLALNHIEDTPTDGPVLDCALGGHR